MSNYYYNSKYNYIYIITFLFILLIIYVLYKFFINVDNKNDEKNIKKYVDNLKKEHLRFPTTFGSGRDYIITKFYNFINDKECNLLIDIEKKKGLHKSEVYLNGGKGIQNEGEDVIPKINESERISEQTWLTNNLKNDNFIIDRIKLLTEYITGISKDNQEDLQVVKYNNGGYFKEHYDACQGDKNECYGMNGKAGQRITTLLIYLNDDFEGGETNFVHKDVNIKIKPVKGMAILFYNVSEVDLHNVHPLSKHKGTKLINGTKWISNIWSHQNSNKEIELTKEEIEEKEKINNILNSSDEKCKCPNCPNPNCDAKKEKILKCRMNKCLNENCANYFLRHMNCKCPNCGNPYCQSKKLKECINPLCNNINCENAINMFNKTKKSIIDHMVK